MATTLKDVEADEGFRGLNPQDQEYVRMQFLKRVVLPDEGFKGLSTPDKATISNRVMAIRPGPVVSLPKQILQTPSESILTEEWTPPVSSTIPDVIAQATQAQADRAAAEEATKQRMELTGPISELEAVRMAAPRTLTPATLAGPSRVRLEDTATLPPPRFVGAGRTFIGPETPSRLAPDVAQERMRKAGLTGEPRTLGEQITDTRLGTAVAAGWANTPVGMVARAFGLVNPEGVEQARKDMAENPTLIETAITSALPLVSPESVWTFGRTALQIPAEKMLPAFIKILGVEQTKKAITSTMATRAGVAGATSIPGFGVATRTMEQAAQAKADDLSGRPRKPLAESVQEVLAPVPGEVVLGAGFGPAAAISRPAMRAAVEAGWFVSAPALIEGKTPTIRDALDAGILLGAIKLSHAIPRDLANAIAKPKSARTPGEQATVDALPPETIKDLLAALQQAGKAKGTVQEPIVPPTIPRETVPIPEVPAAPPAEVPVPTPPAVQPKAAPQVAPVQAPPAAPTAPTLPAEVPAATQVAPVGFRTYRGMVAPDKPTGDTRAKFFNAPTGETPTPAPAVPQAAPIPAGFVRFYHGGIPGEGSRWLSPDYAYAKGYADKSPGGVVRYVDIPEDSPLLKKAFDDTGTIQKAPYVAFEGPADIMATAKSYPTIAPQPAAVPAPSDPIAVVAQGLRDLAEKIQPTVAPEPGQAQPRAELPAPVGTEVDLQAQTTAKLDVRDSLRQERAAAERPAKIEAAQSWAKTRSPQHNVAVMDIVSGRYDNVVQDIRDGKMALQRGVEVVRELQSRELLTENVAQDFIAKFERAEIERQQKAEKIAARRQTALEALEAKSPGLKGTILLTESGPELAAVISRGDTPAKPFVVTMFDVAGQTTPTVFPTAQAAVDFALKSGFTRSGTDADVRRIALTPAPRAKQPALIPPTLAEAKGMTDRLLDLSSKLDEIAPLMDKLPLAEQQRILAEKAKQRQEQTPAEMAALRTYGVEAEAANAPGAKPAEVGKAKGEIPEPPAAGGKAGTSLDAVIADLADRAKAIAPPLQPGASVFLSLTGREADTIAMPGGTALRSESPEAEARIQAAEKGAPVLTIMDRVQGIMEKVRRLPRHFPELGPKEDAAVIDILRRFEAVPASAKAEARDALQGILAKLGKKRTALFTRNIALEDMQKNLDAGLYGEGDAVALPFYTRTESIPGLPPGQPSVDVFTRDLSRFRAIMDANPEIREAYDLRQRYMRALREESVALDLLPETVLADDRYFHHQVLLYMAAKEQFTGTSSKDVRLHRKGWQRARVKNANDFNMDYLEAEFEVVSQQLAQIKTARILKELEDTADTSREVRAKGKVENYKNIVGGQENLDRLNHLRALKAHILAQEELESGDRAILKQISEEIWSLDPTMPFRQKIARGYAGIAKELGRGGISEEAFPDSYDPDTGEMGNISMQEIAKLADNGSLNARMILKAIGGRDAFMRETLGKAYLEWKFDIDKRLLPEGYTTWQPKEGNYFYKAKTIADRVVDEVIAGTRPLTESDVRTIQAIGGKRKQWVIPERLAKTLDNFRDFKDEGAVAEMARFTNTSWKQWTLLNPMRVLKYNFNNFSGDLDIVLAATPRILAKADQAAVEAWRYFRGKGMSSDVRQALELGVIDSGLTITEVPDIKNEGVFQYVTGREGNLLERYWGMTKGLTNMRENVLRIAAFKYAKQEITAGKTFYWASNKAEVDAITDPTKKAAKVARELLGDYGGISYTGQYVRQRLVPFYSWCVPSETEILARDGWKRREQLIIGEDVLTYNMRSRVTEWQPLQDVAAYPFDGNLITLKNMYGFKYQFTPDHRVPVIEQYGDKRKMVLAKNIKSHHKIPVVAPHSFTGPSILGVDDAALLGWIVTDGYFRWKGKSCEMMIYQHPSKHANYLRQRFARYISSEYIHPDSGVICFRLSTSTTRAIKDVFKGKDDLPSIISRLDRISLEALRDAMIMAEGTVRPDFTAFTQNDGPILDAFQVACYLLGQAAHIRDKKCDGVWKSNGTHKSVYVKRRDRISIHKWQRGEEHYAGMVWCPKTSNGTWIMRQNGKVLVTGNCEINAPRYYRLLKNVPNEEGVTAARAAGMVGAAGLKVVRGGADLALKAMGLYALANFFNMSVFPDENDELNRMNVDRKNFHIITGRNADGSVSYVRFQGALSDALSWFSAENLAADYVDISAGKKTWGQKAEEVALAPVSRIVQGALPIPRAIGEVIAGKSLYPDLTNPRVIRDPYEHIARTLSVDMPYRYLAGKPVRGIQKDIKGIYSYSVDPRESSYFRIKELERDFLDKNNLQRPAVEPTDKMNALYYYRQAERYGDTNAMEKYMAEYVRLGGKGSQLQAAWKRQAPLSGIPKKYQAEFLKSLTPAEKTTLEQAKTWHAGTAPAKKALSVLDYIRGLSAPARATERVQSSGSAIPLPIQNATNPVQRFLEGPRESNIPVQVQRALDAQAP